MWVMVVRKIPTSPAPPPLGIFWAIRDFDEKDVQDRIDLYVRYYCDEQGREIPKSKKQYNALKNEVMDLLIKGEWKPDLHSEDLFHDGWCGYEPNRANAVWIHYKGKDIKLWGHEYTIISDDRLKEYLNLGSHKLIVDDVASHSSVNIQIELSPEYQTLYEAALLEGATEQEAKLLTLGLLELEEGSSIKPTGWYECEPEYVEWFGF